MNASPSARVRRHVTFANTVALLALAVAVAGTSWAAVQLPKNSVGTKQLRKNAVTSAKIRAGQVRAADIGANAVTAAKVADGAVDSGAVADGAVALADLADATRTSLLATDATVVGSSQLPTGTTTGGGSGESFTLQRAARVLVFGRVTSLTGTCTGGSCTAAGAVLIDDTPAPGAFREGSASTGNSFNIADATVVGVSDTLAAGAHTVKFAAYKSGGFSAGPMLVASGGFTVVALG